MAASRGKAVVGSLRQVIQRAASSSTSAAAASSSSSPSSSSSSWQPPIKPGVEPAYDEAVKFLSDFQASIKEKLPRLDKERQSFQAGSSEREAADARYQSHVIASQINDPQIRWEARNKGNVDLRNPTFAYIRELSWRQERLPREIERIRLMKVVPDALPMYTPMTEVQVFFGAGEGIQDHGGEGGEVQVGVVVDSSLTTEQPAINVTPYNHQDERLYTIILLDVDSPDDTRDRLESMVHWHLQNVPLSLSKTIVKADSDNIVLPFIPPHPQKGTKYHRYCVVVLEQLQGFLPASTEFATSQFTQSQHIRKQSHYIHDLLKDETLRPTGVHFWRSIWSNENAATISKIYQDILKIPEPNFVALPIFSGRKLEKRKQLESPQEDDRFPTSKD